MLLAALAGSALSLPACSWDRPGADVYRGDVAAAVDYYTDIPPAARAALKKRMAAYQYDEVATIRRDSIEGKYRYDDLRDMHFGQGQVCRSVTRDKWPVGSVERGLVYCEGEHCLIVPTVCRNVSRVTREPATPVAEAPAAAATPGAAQGAAAPDELLFEAPGAGPAPTPASTSFAGASEGPAMGPSAAAPARSTIGPAFVGSSAGGPGGWPAGFGSAGLVPLNGPGASLPTMPATPLLAVPEASTAASMAAGLAVLLAALRRRRRAGA